MNLKKAMTTVLAVATVAAMTVGALAWFTDRVEANATATAGTLELELSNFTAVNNTDMKPGSGSDITYTLTNIGNKSADIREYFIINTDTDILTPGSEEFDIYPKSVVTYNNGNAVISDTSAALAKELSADGKTLTFTVTPFTVNGDSTKANAESEAGITTNSKSGEYVLVLSSNVGNNFGGIEFDMYYEAQAKQHRNTGDGTWAEVAVHPIVFAGNNNYTTVAEK